MPHLLVELLAPKNADMALPRALVVHEASEANFNRGCYHPTATGATGTAMLVTILVAVLRHFYLFLAVTVFTLKDG